MGSWPTTNVISQKGRCYMKTSGVTKTLINFAKILMQYINENYRVSKEDDIIVVFSNASCYFRVEIDKEDYINGIHNKIVKDLKYKLSLNIRTVVNTNYTNPNISYLMIRPDFSQNLERCIEFPSASTDSLNVNIYNNLVKAIKDRYDCKKVWSKSLQDFVTSGFTVGDEHYTWNDRDCLYYWDDSDEYWYSEVPYNAKVDM